MLEQKDKTSSQPEANHQLLEEGEHKHQRPPRYGCQLPPQHITIQRGFITHEQK